MSNFLFDCPLYKQIREQRDFLFGLDYGSTRLFFKRNAAQMSCAAHTFTRAFKPGCPMSHIGSPPIAVNYITLFYLSYFKSYTNWLT